MTGGRPRRRRLFFALWPDEATRAALGAAAAGAAAAAGGRAVAAANLHLTLEFLGQVPDAQLDSLRAVGASLALPEESLLLDRLDWWRRAAMLVAAPSAPGQALLAAQADLRQVLKARGFRVDSRAFRPHVTLARKLTAPPPAAAPIAVAWPVRELALVESVPTPTGSRYTPLARWRGGVVAADIGAL